jgi:ABC-type multidrug transport system permease subunit
MNPRFITLAAVKDLRRIRSEPFAFAIWLGIPVVLAGLLSLLFGSAPPTPQGRLLVADEDETIVSQAFSAAFTRGPLGKMVLVERTTATEGRARIERGDASAYLFLPKGLQQAFLNNQPAKLVLLTNPSQHILPEVVRETLSMVVDAGFYLQYAAGGELRAFTTGRAPTDDDVARSAMAFNGLVRSVSRSLDPPLIQLETVVAAETSPTQSKSFAALFFPTTLFMSLLFIANGLALDIWKERMAGTLRRLAVTPVPVVAFLAGRVLTVALVMAAVGALGLSALLLLAGLPAERVPAAGVWLVLTGCVFFLLLLALCLQPATQRAANVWGNLLILPLMMLGGGFMPFEMMPAWMARIGRMTPNGWALTRFSTILEGKASAPEIAIAVAALALMGTAAFWLASRSLKKAAVA